MNTLEQLIAMTNRYYQRGWTPATSSNFSIRSPSPNSNIIQITRSGRHKGTLTQQDFMRIKTTGEAIDDGRPSAATDLHLLVYQEQVKIHAVLHTHSPAATVLSMAHTQDALEFNNYEIAKAFPEIETHKTPIKLYIYDNDQDIPALATRIKPQLHNLPIPGFIIRGHGVYTWGETLVDAERHLEAIEYLLSCEILRRQIANNTNELFQSK